MWPPVREPIRQRRAPIGLRCARVRGRRRWPTTAPSPRRPPAAPVTWTRDRGSAASAGVLLQRGDADVVALGTRRLGGGHGVAVETGEHALHDAAGAGAGDGV